MCVRGFDKKLELCAYCAQNVIRVFEFNKKGCEKQSDVSARGLCVKPVLRTIGIRVIFVELNQLHKGPFELTLCVE